MASSQNDRNHSLDKEEDQASSATNHASPENHQSPATGYPLTMGYPPSMGYPSDQSPYSNNNGFHNQTYPYNPQFPPPTFIPPQPKPRLSGFCRGLIGGLIFLFFFTFIISLVSWLIFHPFLPDFRVDNFSVSNFNVSSAANFAANVTVRNPNSKLGIYLDNIQVYIFRGGDVLASNSFNAFMLNTKESRSMEVKLSANGTDSDEKYERAVGKMAEERNSTGKVGVSLRMMIWGTFNSGKWMAKSIVIKVFCEDLKVGFLENNSTNANLQHSSDCLVVSH